MPPSVLTAVATGSEDAMRTCVDRYGGIVWSIARRLSKNSAEAEDAVQEAFLAIWKASNRFDELKSSEKTFVTMVARRKIIDRLRASQRDLPTESLTAIGSEVPAAVEENEFLETQEEAERVRKLMGELKEDERRVLELAVDSGLSQTEIAVRTGLPIGTVKTHARRGMLRLRELLSNDTTYQRGTTR